MARKKKIKKLVVVDGTNLAFRAYFRFKGFTHRGEESGLIFGFIRLLQQYLIRLQPDYVVVCLDSKQSKQSNFRINILKQYKIHREKRTNPDFNPDSFNFQLKILRSVLPEMGISVIYDTRGLGFEADDYVAYVAKKFDGKTIILSSDKDFNQLIEGSGRIQILAPKSDTLTHYKTYESKWGHHYTQARDYLILLGDTSDDIPGYNGMGKIRTNKFLYEFKSIRKFLDDPKSEFKPIDKETLKHIYHRNRKLIDLCYSIKLIEETLKGKLPIKYSTNSGKINSKDWHEFTERFGLQSFNRPNFIEPFTKLKSVKRWKVNKLNKIKQKEYEQLLNTDRWPLRSREDHSS
jgi:5'-3' exonuclease